MRDLVESEMDGDGVVRIAPAGTRPRGRRVTVNRAESPLGWLRSHGLVAARQHEAGERLRGDYERACLAPVVTMRWESRVDGGGGDGLTPGEAQVAAKRRFDAATAAVGPGLDDVLWRVVCAGDALPVVEAARGWPARAAKVVLGIALDRLADHYRLG
ncbi:MAG: DUF6456 domain-containing protein [Janthinobacterium lividum]